MVLCFWWGLVLCFLIRKWSRKWGLVLCFLIRRDENIVFIHQWCFPSSSSDTNNKQTMHEADTVEPRFLINWLYVNFDYNVYLIMFIMINLTLLKYIVQTCHVIWTRFMKIQEFYFKLIQVVKKSKVLQVDILKKKFFKNQLSPHIQEHLKN